MLHKMGVLKNFFKFTDKYMKHSSGGAQSKILQNSQKNIYTGVSFLNKVADWKTETVSSSHWRCSVKKKTSTAALSCKIFKVFKNNCFEEHL